MLHRLVFLFLILGTCGEWVQLPMLEPKSSLNERVKYVLQMKPVEDQTEPKVPPGMSPNVSDSVVKEEKEGYSKDNFLKMLRKAHEIISAENFQTPLDKVKFLTKLENKLLNAIKTEISKVWNPPKRLKRQAGFPSLRGAVLSLSFLTFGVFLINTVRLFIQNIQAVGVAASNIATANVNNNNLPNRFKTQRGPTRR